MRAYAASRCGSLSSFESLMPSMSNPSGRITAAATSGPASAPRPASSAPATRVNPWAASSRSYRSSGPCASVLPMGADRAALVAEPVTDDPPGRGQMRMNVTPITLSTGTSPVQSGGSHRESPEFASIVAEDEQHAIGHRRRRMILRGTGRWR